MPFPIDFAGREEVEIDPEDADVLDGYVVIRSGPNSVFSAPGEYWRHIGGIRSNP